LWRIDTVGEPIAPEEEVRPSVEMQVDAVGDAEGNAEVRPSMQVDAVPSLLQVKSELDDDVKSEELSDYDNPNPGLRPTSSAWQ